MNYFGFYVFTFLTLKSTNGEFFDYLYAYKAKLLNLHYVS